MISICAKIINVLFLLFRQGNYLFFDFVIAVVGLVRVVVRLVVGLFTTVSEIIALFLAFNLFYLLIEHRLTRILKCHLFILLKANKHTKTIHNRITNTAKEQ